MYILLAACLLLLQAWPLTSTSTFHGSLRRNVVLGLSSTSERANTSAALSVAQRADLADSLQQCNIIAEYGPRPSECPQGNEHFTRSELEALVPEFIALLQLQAMHLGTKHCCMGFNHMFALFTLVKKLRPAAIIESGVAAGHETWMLRMAAGPRTPIYSIDPGDPAESYSRQRNIGYVGWKDTTGATKYFTLDKFKDFAEMEWDKVITDKHIRERTLVVLDDHQSCVSRFGAMQKWGFRWAFYEDNYPFKVATSADSATCWDLGTVLKRDFPVQTYAYGDAFSPNSACGAPLKKDAGNVLYKDKFGSRCALISRDKFEEKLAWLRGNMRIYFEFPALFSPCPSRREPLLGGDPSILAAVGLPPVQAEIWQYGHLFPAFIELSDPSPSNWTTQSGALPQAPLEAPRLWQAPTSPPPPPVPASYSGISGTISPYLVTHAPR